MLQGELREAEVGVDDGPGACSDVGDDDRVGADVVLELRTAGSLHPVLLHPLPQPLALLAGGEGAEEGGAQSEVGEDGAAVVSIAAPAL